MHKVRARITLKLTGSTEEGLGGSESESSLAIWTLKRRVSVTQFKTKPTKLTKICETSGLPKRFTTTTSQ